MPTACTSLQRRSLRQVRRKRATNGSLSTVIGAFSSSIVAVGAGTSGGFGGETLVPVVEIRHNQSLDRTVVQRGPRLAAARATWPAAHFTR